ncbi:FABP family protein [bacterium (Candidatus Blackallbacteria) CG17_big_fil_post_rev_8_21_14_2_50_48_46]|uniref:FABP family protein n=1 Tax=bacterium (Candidatus Blackallbacteria) CG17_big_fil_post_rev_8_21_14_2_50_48_46 TaxID=2014261 RepID=A0A2M7FZT9_9BACT|nr:MAG: FABP family protein [bacterium (Candidatus Blackallbacteria) CG18_big_fil_WC_8_21_14_2_50_49_26]PIW14795.1 MAG: FABP family protein [bacterium (Candidatus Blackallbacteria) CG17_big_fil_post_rev_8_21_14_2_50_48_46]PIW50897.1 MAG: FABP family protein [bacterium (Candidatus Blackallbacteria) CG13_big_fil_rev_8_21_14_2_50_49_14]
MTEDLRAKLGPLAALAGVWEGSKGDDIAPSDDRGIENNKYREHLVLEPFGPVDNHEQQLYGLRYTTMAWRLEAQDSFHDEVGYWLWDPAEKQVMRCFIVPRGVTVLAGGTVEPDAKAFKLSAELGSETYGICSNRFLDREFKTLRYDLSVTVHEDGSFSYLEDTQMKMKGRDEIFHHTDQNTLKKISD